MDQKDLATENNRSEIYIYPGRLTNHSYKAYRATHMLIAGNQSDTDAFVDNLIVRLCQENNPRDFGVCLFTDSETIWNKAVDEEETRYMPQIRHVYQNGDLNDAVKFLEEVSGKILERTEHNIRTSSWKHRFCIMHISYDLYKQLITKLESWSEIIFKNFVNVYFILAVYSDKDVSMDLNIAGTDIPLRVCCASVSSGTSKSIVGSDIAPTGDGNSFFIKYALDKNLNYMYQCRFPKTFIYKFIRYYGVKRDG